MVDEDMPGQPGRLEALLERWQTSLDLHAKYAALDDTRYWHVQPWPRHERPQRWIIQLARKRILALKRIVKQREAEGDRAFIEGVEIMGFLATLVGLTSVERFLPLASPETERHEVLTARPEAPARGAESRPAAETTRQMPTLSSSRITRALAASKAGAAPKDTAARRREPGRPATIKPRKSPAKVSQAEHVVIADAVRLLGWGKQWHELADMIGRLAERPAAGEIRRILRTYREQIDAVVRKRGG